MNDRKMLLFEKTFYDARIASWFERIAQYNKKAASVKNERSSLDVAPLTDSPSIERLTLNIAETGIMNRSVGWGR